MTISWHGFNYFKVKNTDHTLVFNPYSLDNVTKVAKTKADVVLFSDKSKLAQAKYDDDAFVLDTPGECEIHDIFIYGRKVSGQLIFQVTMEDIKIVFMGEFGHQELNNGDLEFIKATDILILPVGGGDFCTAKEANKIISQLEPRIVIPSCHKAGAGKLKLDSIEDFVKEFSVKPEQTDKLRIKKKDLPQEEVKLVVLSPQ
ncbi:hypothetical protein C4566_02335 [Candidatus Parcubacteria bacterium]|nr:MAG: hypothetical protein C4566_02335 [Candidatus Parcubacteria bacterium]